MICASCLEIVSTTFMLWVSFSLAPECVVIDSWNRPFSDPLVHQDGAIIVIDTVVVYFSYHKN